MCVYDVPELQHGQVLLVVMVWLVANGCCLGSEHVTMIGWVRPPRHVGWSSAFVACLTSLHSWLLALIVFELSCPLWFT